MTSEPRHFLSRSYAPWCPACQQLQPVWKEFADWGEDMGVNVAKVDVTEHPGRPEMMPLQAHCPHAQLSKNI